MNEYRVYYDDLGEFTVKVNNLCQSWRTQLNNIEMQILDFMKAGAIEGDSAEAMRRYIWEVHYTTIQSLKTLVNNFDTKIQGYYLDYCKLDEGDGSKYGQRYTTFVASELRKGGSVEKRLYGLINEADDIRTNISNVYKEISNYTENSHSIPSNNDLRRSLNYAIKKATDSDSLVSSIERMHFYDLKNIDVIITSLTTFINRQLSYKRIPVVSYRPGEIHQICDTQQLMISVENCNKDTIAFVSSGRGKKVSELLADRQKLIEQEEKDSRQWANWVSTGVTVLAAATVIVASATGVGVVGVVVIGAVSGSISGATSCVTDHYYEEGNLDDLDYSKLAKETIIGGISGAASGYTAAVGFAAKAGGVALTTADKVVIAMTEESAKTLTNMSIDTGSAIGYELNRLITGDETGVQRQYETFWKDTNDGVKNIILKPAKACVGGIIEEDFKWTAEKKKAENELNHLITGKNTDARKGVIKKGLEAGAKKFVKTAATETTDQAITITHSAATGKYSNQNGSKELEKDLRKGWSKVAGKSSGAFISGITSSVTTEKIDSVRQTYIKKPAKVVNDTINNTVSSVTEKMGITTANNTINAMSNDEERESISLRKLWDDTLQGGRSLVKDAADSTISKVGDHINKEYRTKELENRHKGMLYEEIRDNYIYEEIN